MENLATSSAYVSQPKNGWITVYDEEADSQDNEVICGIAEGLSRAVNTDVFGFLVHDSDIAAYWLFTSGKLADQFNSAPDYFGDVSDEERDATRGDTDALLALCVPGTTAEMVDAVIHPEAEFPAMADEILFFLAGLLGIEENRIGLSFEYFEDDGEGILGDVSEFERVEADV